MVGRLLIFLLCIAVSAAMFPCPVLAQGQGKGKNKQVEREGDRDIDRDEVRGQTGRPIFSTRDRDIIREYFRGGYSNLPPGLAKRGGNLPPGLQKHLERDGTLPPGLQKRLTPFPEELQRRLPRLPDIYRRGTIGDVAVIIDRRTQRIMDVIDDVLRP